MPPSPLEAVMSARGLGAGLRPPRRADRASIARRSSSSTRGGWRSAWRGICPSGSARTTSWRTTAAWRRSCGFDAEQRLKSGELKALVATASLELGIDIGDVELVCQLGSPRSIAAFLQRVGRVGPPGRRHAEGPAVSAVARRARRVRGAARLRCAAASSIALRCPTRRSTCSRSRSSPRSARSEWNEDELFALVRARVSLSRPRRASEFDAVVRCSPTASARAAAAAARYLHRDAVNGVLRGRRGARLTAITSGGAIPDNADYDVVLEPEGQVVGTVNEDFAVESLAGDIFQLGNTSYRILRVEARTRARRGRAGPAAHDSVLARRGAGPHRRALARGVAPARRDRAALQLDASGACRAAIG